MQLVSLVAWIFYRKQIDRETTRGHTCYILSCHEREGAKSRRARVYKIADCFQLPADAGFCNTAAAAGSLQFYWNGAQFFAADARSITGLGARRHRVCHRMSRYMLAAPSIDFNQRGSVAKVWSALQLSTVRRARAPTSRRTRARSASATSPWLSEPRLQIQSLSAVFTHASTTHLNRTAATHAKKERRINDRSRHVRCESIEHRRAFWYSAASFSSCVWSVCA